MEKNKQGKKFLLVFYYKRLLGKELKIFKYRFIEARRIIGDLKIKEKVIRSSNIIFLSSLRNLSIMNFKALIQKSQIFSFYFSILMPEK